MARDEFIRGLESNYIRQTLLENKQLGLVKINELKLNALVNTGSSKGFIRTDIAKNADLKSYIVIIRGLWQTSLLIMQAQEYILASLELNHWLYRLKSIYWLA